MTVTEIDAPLFLPESDEPRSPGVHLSSIIRRIAIQEGILTTDEEESMGLLSDHREITDPVAILRISIGLAWEQYYIPRILGPALDVVDHPGEMLVDGIYMTPDGESVGIVHVEKRGKKRHDSIVHEIKATYKTARKDIRKQWMWIAQMRSYCRAKGTCHAMLHVLFICGDYSRPIKPMLRTFVFEFTQEELDSTWDLMLECKRMEDGATEEL